MRSAIELKQIFQNGWNNPDRIQNYVRNIAEFTEGDSHLAWRQALGDAAQADGRLKILDVGTTSYRPPELLFGKTNYNISLDLWAAGCVVAESIRLDNKTLFSSGELGSELALIQSIFSTLGTPNIDTWPVSCP